MPLTEQQHQQIDQLIAAGELDENKFLSRLAAGDTFAQAINNTLGGRLSSNVRRIFLEAATPGLTIQETVDFFKQRGVLGGVAEIAKGTVTAPFSAIAELATGDVPERPIETLTNLASAIPLARMTAGFAAKGFAKRAPGIASRLQSFESFAAPISQVQELAEQVTQPREELLELGGNVVTEGLGLASGAFAQNVETGAGAPARAPSVELEPVVEDEQGNFVPEINLPPQQPSPEPEAEIDTAPTELEPIPTSETFAKGSRVRVINAEGQLGDNTFVVQRLDGDTAHITVEGSTTGTSMPVPVSQLFPGDAVVELTAADLEAELAPTVPPRPQEPFVPPDINLLPSSVETPAAGDLTTEGATPLPPEPPPPPLSPEINLLPQQEGELTPELEAIPEAEAEAIRTEEAELEAAIRTEEAELETAPEPRGTRAPDEGAFTDEDVASTSTDVLADRTLQLTGAGVGLGAEIRELRRRAEQPLLSPDAPTTPQAAIEGISGLNVTDEVVRADPPQTPTTERDFGRVKTEGRQIVFRTPKGEVTLGKSGRQYTVRSPRTSAPELGLDPLRVEIESLQLGATTISDIPPALSRAFNNGHVLTDDQVITARSAILEARRAEAEFVATTRKSLNTVIEQVEVGSLPTSAGAGNAVSTDPRPNRFEERMFFTKPSAVGELSIMATPAEGGNISVQFFPSTGGNNVAADPAFSPEERADLERQYRESGKLEAQGELSAPITALEARNLIQDLARNPGAVVDRLESELSPRELKIADDLTSAGILETRGTPIGRRFQLAPKFQNRAGIATQILDSLGETTPVDPAQLAAFLESEIGRLEAGRQAEREATEAQIVAGAPAPGGVVVTDLKGPKRFVATYSGPEGDIRQSSEFKTEKLAFDFAQNQRLAELGIRPNLQKRFGLSRDHAIFLVGETRRRLPLLASHSNPDGPTYTTISIPDSVTLADLTPVGLSSIHRRLTGLPLISQDVIGDSETYSAALGRLTDGTGLGTGEVAIEGDLVTVGDATYTVTGRQRKTGRLEVERVEGGTTVKTTFAELEFSKDISTLTKGPGHDIERLRTANLDASSPFFANNVEPLDDFTRPRVPGTTGRRLITPEDLDYEVRSQEGASKAQGADAIEAANDVANHVSSTRPDLDRPQGPSLISEEGIRTLGHAFTPELIKTGQIDLRGQTIRGPADIAELAQIYRDPRFETLRIFYIKNEVVVGHEGVSSRMPAFVSAFIRGNNEAEFDAHTVKRMGDLGADGYYLQHNHPSTDTTPSANDIKATERIQRSVPGFLGHVIIDHKDYTVLREAKSQIVSEVVRRDAGADALMQASIPHKYLNVDATRPDDIVNIGKAMAVEDGYVTLLFLDTKGKVRVIQEVPIPFFTNVEKFPEYLRQIGRQVGSPRAVTYYGGNDTDVGDISVDYVVHGTLLDAVHNNSSLGDLILKDFNADRGFFGSLTAIEISESRVFFEEFAKYNPTPETPDQRPEGVVVVGRGTIAGRFRNLLANPLQTMRFRLGHHPAGQWFKQLVGVMSAGQTTLRRSGAPGETLLNLAFDNLEDIPRRASGPERVAVNGLLKHTDRMVRKWRKDRGMSKGIAYAEIHRQIWDHLEGDAPVDTELTGLAGAWRAWRARQVDFHQRVMIEQSQLHEARFGVPIMIHSPDGSMRPWSPIKGEVGLYMPHYHKNTDVVFRRMIQDAEATNDVDLKARIKNYQKWLENGEAIRQHHLETERFFDLPGYTKDLSILNGDSFSFWRRVGELSAFGQNNQHLTVMSNAIANHSATDLETAVKAFSDVVVNIARGMKLNIEGESRFEGGQNRVDELVAIANAQKRPVASELFVDMTTQQLDRLEREGLFHRATRADGVPGLQLTDRGAETIMRDFARRQMRRFQANQVISQLQHWKDVDPFEREARNVWGKMGNFATITMISVFTSLQNVFESTLLLTKTGAIPFAKATFSLATDREMIRMGEAIGATFEDATAFMVEDQIHHPSKFLKAYGFTVTEKFTRVLGASAGWHAAIDLIDKDLSRGRPRTEPGRRNRRQRFAELRIDMRRIREAMDAEGATVEDFRASLGDIKRGVLEGATAVQGIRQPTRRDLPDWTNVVADEMSKSALFVSQEVFKRYNRLDLPGFLVSKHPIIRVLGKFKGWYAQQHRYMRATFIQAIREARHLNFGPMIRLIEGMAAMGLGGMAYNAIMSQLTGRKEDEDKTLFESVIKGIAGIGGFGYYGTLAEVYRREGGNQFRIRSRLESMLLGPVFGRGAGIASQTIEAVTTGNVEGLAREAGRLVPSGIGRTIVPRIPRGGDRGVSPGERARRRANRRN